MFKVVFVPTFKELGTLRIKFKTVVKATLEELRRFIVPPSVER
jgi:hypothetical protein